MDGEPDKRPWKREGKIAMAIIILRIKKGQRWLKDKVRGGRSKAEEDQGKVSMS